MKNVLVVIPARLHSTRLPKKVILRETGKFLVQHVYERALLIEGASEVIIATDHPEVQAAAESFGANVVMTSPHHQSGSDRAAEVAKNHPCDLVVNLQADEPELEPKDVANLISAMTEAEMGTLVYPELTEEDQKDESIVKAVVEDGWATDFLRTPTPGAQRHLGIYAYTPDFLQRFTRLSPTKREQSRRLEQMRALDHNVRIRAVRAIHCGIGIDTPADYAAFVERYRTA